MARVFSSGFEHVSGGNLNGASNSNGLPDTQTATLAIRETTIKRSGNSSMRVGASASSQIYTRFSLGWANSFTRVFFYKSQNPAGTEPIIQLYSATSVLIGYIKLTATGTLAVFNSANVQQGSASAAAPDATWNKLEFNIIDTGTSFTITARLNETAFVTTATIHGVGSLNFQRIDFIGPSTAACLLYWDDLSVNSNAGAVNNSWPADSKVLMLQPIADVQQGTWFKGAGGSGNLWDSINNIPPTGKLVPADGDQIDSTDSTGNNATDEYRVQLQSYATVGVNAGDTINGVQAWCAHGELNATGSKTGSMAGFSNPVIAAEAFTFGGDNGTLGSWPTLWYWQGSGYLEAPTVSLGVSPVLAFRKTDATAGASEICAAFMYVDVTPAAPAGGTNLNLKDSFKMPLAARKILKRTLRV